MDAKKAVIKSFIIILAIYVASGFLFALMERNVGDSLYQIFEVKKKIADSKGAGGRILISGGSNVLWGFRSQIVEERLKKPTINIGMYHEAYGPAVMQALTLQTVQDGDTVLYSSITMWDARPTDAVAGLQLLAKAGLTLDDSHIQQWLSRIHRYWLPKPEKGILARELKNLMTFARKDHDSKFYEAYNDYGDIKSCTSTTLPGPNVIQHLNSWSETMAHLAEFRSELEKKGARLILQFPAVLVFPGQKSVWVERYRDRYEELKRDFNLIGPRLEDLIREDASEFCDTGFHLHNEPAINRSKVTADELMKYF